MDQKQTMRDLITDKELTLAYDVTRQVQSCHHLSSKISGLGPGPGDLWNSQFDDSERIEPLFSLVCYGWKIITVARWEKIGQSNDYMSVILVHEKKRLLLLAHRGMQFTDQNMFNCLMIALGKYAPITQDAIEMCEIALNLIDTQYPGFTLCHTGFSMGGFLAQMTASYCNHVLNGLHNEAICYDSPGAEKAINSNGYKDNRSNILIILTSPNLVNTGTRHYGYVKQIRAWKAKNSYENLLNFAVTAPYIIDVEQMIFSKTMGKTWQLASETWQSHQGLFESAFNDKNNFDLDDVTFWPMAENYFSDEEVIHNNVASSHKDSLTSSDDSEKREQVSDLVKFGIGFSMVFANSYAETRTKQIASQAGIAEIKSISHQIKNPEIQYRSNNHKMTVHGEAAPDPRTCVNRKWSEKFRVDSTIAQKKMSHVHYSSPLKGSTSELSRQAQFRKTREPVEVKKRTAESVLTKPRVPCSNSGVSRGDQRQATRPASNR